MSELEKRTWAEISLDNIRHNYRAIRAALPEGCRFLGVVKANAYGHGAPAVAKTLEECGADYLAVATIGEGVELREAGFTQPILLLGLILPEEAAERNSAVLLIGGRTAHLYQHMVHPSQGVVKQFLQHLPQVVVMQVEGSPVDLSLPAEIGDGDVGILFFCQEAQQSLLDDHTGIERAAVGFPRFLFIHNAVLVSEQLDQNYIYLFSFVKAVQVFKICSELSPFTKKWSKL